MKTQLRILCAGLRSLTPLLVQGQNAPETEIVERAANYNLVRVLDALDPAQLAELPPDLRTALEAEGATYIQAASGLNFWDGEWKPSQERFIEYEDGIVAQEGQTKVIISRDFTDPNGVVDLLSPNGPGIEGERLRLSVAGLAIFDRKSGQSALIATPQPSQAILVPPASVVFLNALTGDGVSAYVRMSYRLGSFETDVVLREFPEARDPDTGQVLVGPEIWNLSPENSVIEVIHEVVSAPEPAREVRGLKEEPRETRDQFVEPDIIDEELTFGAPDYELKFVQGKAFALTDEEGEALEDPAQRDRAVPTAKRWLDLGPDGVFLVEQVEYSSVQTALESLPRVQVDAARQPVQGRQRMLASGAASDREGPRVAVRGARPARAPFGAARAEVQTTALPSGGPSRMRERSPALPENNGEPREPAEPVSWQERLAALSTTDSPRLSRHAPRPTANQLALVEDFERRPGFTIDYLTRIGSQQDMVFRGDETYYISGPFTISDSQVFEGGTVIKMDTDAYLSVPDDIEFQTSMYRVVTVTSKYDGTIGQYVAAHDPAAGDYDEALRLDTSSAITIEHARFRYADKAIRVTSNGSEIKIRHAQFVECNNAFYNVSTRTVKLHNILAHDFVDLIYATYQTLGLQHITADQGSRIVNGSYYSVTADNCLFTGITNTASYSGSETVWNPSGTIHQTAGAGNFYLADGSEHRNAGTSSIDSTLKADLEKRTTFPPVVLGESASLTLDEDTVWFPIAQRDNDGVLDRGYHYPPTDYAIHDTYVANGVTLTVKPGTAVAQYGIIGLLPRDGSTVRFQGTAENRINVFRFESVQEDPQRWGGGNTSGNDNYFIIRAWGLSSASKTLQLNFTDFDLADDSYQYSVRTAPGITWDFDNLEIKDCRFSNGYLWVSGDASSTYDVFNNLFSHGTFLSWHKANLKLYNNLFKQTHLSLYQYSGGSEWIVTDNMFADITLGTQIYNATHTVDYNGYVNGEDDYLKGSLQTHDVEGTITFTSGGAFGDYYQPSSGNDFLNAGSRTAASAALAQYTVLDDTSKDTSTVDIGFHYPAVDGNGDPADSDDDGIPDYIEDVNGDGTIGSTEYGDDLWVDTSPSAQQLAELIMACSGVTVEAGSATYTGSFLARGRFGNGTAASLPIATGVILSTGRIIDAVGPNNDYGVNVQGNQYVSNLNEDGDSDLDTLLGASVTYDAAALEFDITSASDITIVFEYLFASEEYPEYVAQEYNDTVGIFVDGSNIALLDPGTVDVEVTVNNVHGGFEEESVSAVNPGYYVDNDDPDNNSLPAYDASDPVYNIQYDGTTVPLTAELEMTANTTYHIKIAIADASDELWDSAVFIGCTETVE